MGVFAPLTLGLGLEFLFAAETLLLADPFSLRLLVRTLPFLVLAPVPVAFELLVFEGILEHLFPFLMLAPLALALFTLMGELEL